MGKELDEKNHDPGRSTKGYIILVAVGFLAAAVIIGGIMFILKNTDQQNQDIGSPVSGLTL